MQLQKAFSVASQLVSGVLMDWLNVFADGNVAQITVKFPDTNTVHGAYTAAGLNRAIQACVFFSPTIS